MANNCFNLTSSAYLNLFVFINKYKNSNKSITISFIIIFVVTLAFRFFMPVLPE